MMQRERDGYAQLSCHQKDEILNKLHEAHRQKKIVAAFVNAQNHGQIEPKQFVQELHTIHANYMYQIHINKHICYFF